MWITQVVFHNQSPGNSKKQSDTSVKADFTVENQREGHTITHNVVDNSRNDVIYNYKPTNKNTNYATNAGKISEIASEISALKEELSTMEKPYKQRGNTSFSSVSEHRGQASDEELWKSEKLSTMTVDKIYEDSKNNPFKAGMLLKKHMAKGVSEDGERMLYAMMVKLDFKCDGDVCEIRVMDKLLPILQNNMKVLQKHSCGFKVKLVGIETFTQNTQVEVDKIKKYFGEEYLKMVDTLEK